MLRLFRRRPGASGLAAILLAALLCLPAVARAADPIKVGFSMSLTGGVAPIGKQIMTAIEIWRDDVNAKGGLLGRPVQLVYYDDQSNPANVPGIYTKLLDVDKVDLLVGPYGTGAVTPALPVVMQKNMLTIGILANSANANFHYSRYFAMNPTGQDPEKAYSTGFFTLASAQNPKPKTVALVGVDAEFGQNALAGARKNAQEMGFQIVYDKAYPPSTTDFLSVLRAVQATNPDLVYAAAYPPDTVGLLQAAHEIGLNTKMFGGAMIGLFATPIKMKLGPLMNGLVAYVSFLPAKTLIFPGTQELLDHYAAQAASKGIDPLGYSFPPLGYAACQVLAEAVTATKSLDQDKLADYIRGHSFKTVVGEVSFGKDGEWAKTRVMFTQFQHVDGNGIEQFKGSPHEAILYPTELKTGSLIYPYAKAKTP